MVVFDEILVNLDLFGVCGLVQVIRGIALSLTLVPKVPLTKPILVVLSDICLYFVLNGIGKPLL